MKEDLSQISSLVRTEIEARFAGPLITAVMEELGREKTLEIVSRIVNRRARKRGALRAKQSGGNSIADFANEGSSNTARFVERDVLTLSDTNYDFNIVRCRYAEMYKELGMADLGYVLACKGDFDMVEGFNPRMKLVRTKTIMEGNDFCDFRITLE